VKPFDLRELLARIRIHLSHETSGTKEQKACIMVAGAEICSEKRTFRNGDGEEVHLTQKEFLILQKLIDQKESVVSRSDIIEYLWGTDALFEGGDNKLDVYISNLRSKLGKAVIKTIK
jgi:DNA-binding response OmpR family regulator